MCKHPLKGFQLGLKTNGKQDLKITSYKVDYVYRRLGDETWHLGSGEPYLSPDVITITDFIEIPCGRCIECRLNHARDWADRCMLEAREHESNYFLTLTYDPEHVPVSHFENPVTGEIGDNFTLKKKDFQDFMKRLRFNTQQKIRFFACGEYGDHTFRPHYHMIAFNLKLDDLEPFGESSQGFTYYTSKTISKAWKQGHVIVSNVSWDTCCYTARYVCKKRKDDETDRYQKSFYERYNLQPEFVLMSRRPGIARDYYDKYKGVIYETDKIYLETAKGGKTHKPCRYFDKLFEVECPELFCDIKENRRLKADLMKARKLDNTDLTYEELLDVEEKELIERTITLKRNMI